MRALMALEAACSSRSIPPQTPGNASLADLASSLPMIIGLCMVALAFVIACAGERD